MAAALGFALAQGALAALAVFVALGIGFALPFILLGIWPRALAFPMYAAAAWLVWVLSLQAGPTGVAVVLAAMIALALAAWLWSVTRNGSARIIGIVVALLVLGAGLYGLTLLKAGDGAAAVPRAAHGEPYTAAKLAEYRAAGRPVFVDATAAWCITCLVNEEAVLSKDGVQQAFAAKKVVYMVADWTNRNPEITTLLKENGRSGVPLYAYYAPGAASPKILPQILTESEVLSALQ
ncbi:MAG: hypothetical protein EOP93_18105 [Lysobacteraceae bacterium]|nr:MAG: hypothetical protein EOP93_18105 [Xanthomonadaceae bacterium]